MCSYVEIVNMVFILFPAKISAGADKCKGRMVGFWMHSSRHIQSRKLCADVSRRSKHQKPSLHQDDPYEEAVVFMVLA